ncbi:hypothetical protein [uncultured Roseobacter sp.]|uniref:hypothetical protein n=1 Tax=uncultured Roseobacter sp. TaxID=114847 RepID=UPI00263651FB|nr:hypothetical protein [uncultured Roseobacter sp.]
MSRFSAVFALALHVTINATHAGPCGSRGQSADTQARLGKIANCAAWKQSADDTAANISSQRRARIFTLKPGFVLTLECKPLIVTHAAGDCRCRCRRCLITHDTEAHGFARLIQPRADFLAGGHNPIINADDVVFDAPPNGHVCALGGLLPAT